MANQPHPAIFGFTVMNATGASTPVDTSKTGQITVSCNSTAGHEVLVEGSLDGVDWAPMHRRTDASTIEFVGGARFVDAVEEDVPLLRFNVASLTTATTLVMGTYSGPWGT